MTTTTNSDKGDAPCRPKQKTWRVDFRRPTATGEVGQWAEERGESRVRQGTPPLFLLRDEDKDEALAEFAGLEPEATPIATETERN